MLILHQSSPKKCHFLAEYCNLQKNIGPISDSMYVIKNTISYYIRRNNKILLDFRFKAFIIVSNCSHLVVTPKEVACRRTRFIEEHLL
jgi:hypothetical protein